jgi:hypothetical protein
VRTPVWFAQDVSHQDPSTLIFYIYSEADSGKVKRLRNNAAVRVAPCSLRGSTTGEWIQGNARLCAAEEAAHAQTLLRRKYGLVKRLGDFFSRLMGHKQAVIAVEIR